MRRSRLASVTVAFVLGSVLPLHRTGGVEAQTAPSRDALVSVASEIIRETRYCVLVTLDGDGTPRVRTMDAFPPEGELIVWLGTTRNSRKVGEIMADPRVALHFTAPGGSGYVSITGEARVVDDPAEKEARWRPEWDAFYADPASEYVLIQVIPHRLEVLDFARGITADPRTWEPPSVIFPR